MSDHSSPFWETLGKWRSTALYLSSGLLILFAIQIVIGFHIPGINIGTLGYLFGIAGILGFYPKVNSQSPRLSLTGTLFLAIAVVTLLGSWAVSLSTTGLIPRFFLPLFYPIIVYTSFFGGYVLYGITVLRSDNYPWLMGMVLLLSPALLTIDALNSIIQGPGTLTEGLTILIVCGNALAHGVIGYMLSKDENKAANIVKGLLKR